MLKIYDEILNGEPKYRIRDKNGNILFDELSIEMITPILQSATPQNKVLYDSIKSGNDLVQKFNIPSVLMHDKNYNYFELDNIITEYDVGMRVFMDFKNNPTDYFGQGLIPKLTAANTAVDGYYFAFQQQASYASNVELVYDKDDSTAGKIYKGGTTLYFPKGIKNFKAKVIVPAGGSEADYRILYFKGRVKGTTSLVGLKTENYYSSTKKEFVFNIQDNKLYDAIGISMSNAKSPGVQTMAFEVYTIDVLEGYEERFHPQLPVYLNINHLGNKLINGTIVEGKKYELVYDGTVFNAREVV